MGRIEITLLVSAFALGIVAFAPAGIVGALAINAAPGLTASGSSGTVWRGVLHGAAYNGAPLGDVEWSARPLDALRARISADVTASGGALEGQGVVRFGGEGVEIADAALAFRLDAIRRYSMFGAPYRGEIKAHIDRLSLSRDGCDYASGSMTSTALDASLLRLNLAALPLAGAISCEDRALVALLTGESRDGRIEVKARATAARAYTLDVHALPRRRDLAQALELAGFERDGSGLKFRASGQLKGIGS
jgi:hypothetical protein